jgi:hypothetical protein
MFSCTLSLAKGCVIWKVRTIPRRAMRCTGQPVISCPSKVTLPVLTGRKPAMHANSVVLPAPLGPISATMRPSSTFSDASSTALRPPKILVRPCTCNIGALIGHSLCCYRRCHCHHPAGRCA